MTEHQIRIRFEESWGPEGISIRKCLALVLRKTPRGAWCKRLCKGYSWQPDAFELEVDGETSHYDTYGKEFFVLDGSGKRRFHETPKQAWDCYRRRKRHSVSFAERRYLIQKEAAELAQKQGEEPPEGKKLRNNPEWNSALDWSEY